MLKNYLKIFLRNVARQPVYTLLNLACLSVGMAAAIMVLLYLDFELTYDDHHEKADRIYRINTTAVRTHDRVMDVNWQTVPANLGAYLQQDYPEVEAFVRLFSFYSNEVRFGYGAQRFEMDEEQLVVADSNVFQVFSFDLLQGDPAGALRGPNKLVISERLAARIFPGEDPLGKVLTTRLVHGLTNQEADYPLEVTGVYRDLPKNTQLYVDAMISAETDPQLNRYYFDRFNVSTYVLLNPQVDPLQLAPKFTEVYDKYLDPALDPTLVNVTHELVALKALHVQETGGTAYIYIFSGIGFLLLLIAFISFVNLVTAQAGRRAAEIGMRKVLGSQKKQLVLQFLSESLLFTLLAFGLSLCWVSMFLSPVNTLLDLSLDTQRLLIPRLILIAFGVIMLLGLLGGSYPAFFLASFRPIAVLKGKLTRSAPLHKYLVGFQFAIVVFVLASTGMIYQQLRFLKAKDLGFAHDLVLHLGVPGRSNADKIPVLKEALRRDPDITSVAGCNFIPGVGGMINRPASAKGSEPQFIRYGRIDYDYLKTMQIGLLAGRNFSPDFPADSIGHVLVNETFVKNFGLGDNPVGELVRFGGWDNPNSMQIIGVVEDFHQSSLHNPIESQLFLLGNKASDIMVKVGGEPADALDHIEKTWVSLFPEEPFTYRFLDDALADRYREDRRRGSIFFFFSLITIFIAFAGLYGLSAYMTRQRTREVGIRKVLGAGVRSVVFLLTKDFLRLALIAAVPGLFIAWYLVGQWLENFAFRTGMNYFLFTLALLSVLLLVFLTVGWHATRTALQNPQKTLKHE